MKHIGDLTATRAAIERTILAYIPTPTMNSKVIKSAVKESTYQLIAELCRLGWEPGPAAETGEDGTHYPCDGAYCEGYRSGGRERGHKIAELVRARADQLLSQARSGSPEHYGVAAYELKRLADEISQGKL